MVPSTRFRVLTVERLCLTVSSTASSGSQGTILVVTAGVSRPLFFGVGFV